MATKQKGNLASILEATKPKPIKPAVAPKGINKKLVGVDKKGIHYPLVYSIAAFEETAKAEAIRLKKIQGYVPGGYRAQQYQGQHMMAIGHALRVARIGQGLTMRGLRNLLISRCGVYISATTISRVENAGTQNIEAYINIARALGYVLKFA